MSRNLAHSAVRSRRVSQLCLLASAFVCAVACGTAKPLDREWAGTLDGGAPIPGSDSGGNAADGKVSEEHGDAACGADASSCGSAQASACVRHPCAKYAVCTDVPAPGVDAALGRSCACPPGRAGDGYTACSPFAHPGLLHTEEDLVRMRDKVSANAEPWSSGWKKMLDRGRTNTGYTARPVAMLTRPGSEFSVAITDLEWAYARAVAWKITGDEKYAQASVDILDAWSSTLVAVDGNADRFLAAGILGYQFANVGEIMRTWSGWKPDRVGRFEKMLLEVFYPMNHDFLTNHNGTESSCISNYWANWDLYNVAAMVSIGVFSEHEDIYQEAIDYLYRGRGNGNLWNAVWYVHPGYLGQWQESGRDQGHSTGALSMLGVIAQTLYNQGVDIFAEDNNRLLAAAEYVAKSNLIANPDAPAAQQRFYDVPWLLYGKGVGQGCTWELMTAVSTAGQGIRRPLWELWHNHYVNRLGLAAPYVSLMAERMRPDQGSGDEFGYTTLTFSRDPIAEGAPPSGLTARTQASSATLSWWGTAYATRYVLERALSADGPFEAIAEVGPQADRTFEDGDLRSGVVYWYRVVASTPSGERVSKAVRASSDVEPVLRLEAAAPDRLTDTSGRSHAVSLAGSAKLVRGRQGDAIDLDGRGGHVVLPNAFLSDAADFTLAAWIFLRSDAADQHLFVSAVSQERYLSVNVRSSSADANVRVASASNSARSEEGIDSTRRLPLMQWSHLAVTYRAGEATIYIDGAKAGEGPTPTRMRLSDLGRTTQNWIGRSSQPAGPSLDALVEDLRMYKGAMSAADIAGLAAR